MFEQTQFDLLRPWVMKATQLDEVILAHGSAPRPVTDYAVLNLIRSSRIGHVTAFDYEENPAHATDPVNEPPFFEIAVQEYEFTWTFQVYTQDPVNVANRLTPWHKSVAGREGLGPLNMFDIADVLRVPEMVENNWNDRATTEFRVRSYVCTGTSTFGTNEILLGRVPVDVAETVSVLFPETTPALTLTTDKP